MKRKRIVIFNYYFITNDHPWFSWNGNFAVVLFFFFFFISLRPKILGPPLSLGRANKEFGKTGDMETVVTH